MTNALTTIDTNTSAEALLAMAGFGGDSDGNLLPGMKPHHAADIAVNGTEYVTPAGSLKVQYEGDTLYFTAGNIKIRPFIRVYRFVHYEDDAEGKTQLINQTTFQTSNRKNVEFLDVKGGQRCGRMLNSSEIKELPVEQQKILNQIKPTNGLFAWISGTGVRAAPEGVPAEKIEVKDFPVFLELHGANYAAFDDAIKKIAAAKVMPFQVQLTMGKPKKERNGSTTYYVLNLDVSTSEQDPVTDDFIEGFKQFTDHISEHNSRIIKQHTSALSKKEDETLSDDEEDYMDELETMTEDAA